KKRSEIGGAKKIEAKKRRLAAIEAKQSKSKAKKLAKILERKRQKESRESLFESLQQYQLTTDSMKGLASVSQMQNKEKKLKIEKNTVFPEKLNSLAGGESVRATIHNRTPQQENYYETDTESDEEIANTAEEQATTSTNEVVGMDEEIDGRVHIADSAAVIDTVDIKVEESESRQQMDDGDGREKKVSKEEGVKAARQYMQRVRSDTCASANGTRQHVMVARSEQVEAQRAKLPIYAEEQVIVEAINENTCVIISGETGSGKTTQLPQFLYEAGYSSGGQLIGITEPRRVAAISMAARVAYEMNLKDVVSYQVIYCSFLYCFFLKKKLLRIKIQIRMCFEIYIFRFTDEAHERSMYSDVLIGLLSRITPLRARTDSPLKLIIMSATLRLDDFTQKLLFPSSPPRVLKVESRQFPVTIHFERRTPEDYLRAAFRKVCRIHEELPPGTILVFLSGRLEVETLLKWLIVRYPIKRKSEKVNVDSRFGGISKGKRKRRKNIDVRLDNYRRTSADEERNADLDDLDVADDIDDEIIDEDLQDGMDDTSLGAPPAHASPLYCLPLYSLLSSEKQRKVFEPVPDGCRLCVIATNVAETSLTIAGVRYVVDSGREKRRVHDPVTGVSQFIVHWISQASADQRAGRAGRVQAGHVYRLYSSAVFTDLEKFSVPEILNKPVDQLVLHMKSMNIIKMDDTSLGAPPAHASPLYCLPLYSLLSSEKQRKVFEPVPDGCRLCVIATNVAETSLTIAGVRYVVDSGREKRRVHDPVTGVSQFIVHWISQASADQRAGRAGRVQAGHVYRLYSSAVFTDLEKFSVPEILNKPVDQLVLHMKSMNIIKVSNFPFPTRPDRDALEEAEKRLIRLGALEIGIKNKVKEARISALGKTLSMFPLAPKFAKILVMANQHGLLPYACVLVAVLSVREPLIPIYSLRGETNEETQAKMLEALKQRRAWCLQGQARRFGDLTVLLKAVLACIAEKGSEEACKRFGVRRKALVEVSKLRHQLTNLINSSCQLKQTLTIDPSLTAPSEAQIRMLRQIVIASLSDSIARRIDRSSCNDEVPKGAYECQKLKDYVFIDASSVLYKDEPDWVLFQEIVQVNDKKCMQNVMTVESEWLPRLANAYCEFGTVKDAEPKYDRSEDAVVVAYKCSFGDRNWSLGEVNRPMASNLVLYRHFARFFLGYDRSEDAVVVAYKCSFGDRNWSLGEVNRPMASNLVLYRHFARFFLDGSVCPPLAEYADKLLLSPATMIKPWAKLQQRTERLLNALVEYEVTSRARLLEVWKMRSEYLLDEYLEWVPRCFHDSVQLAWPPTDEKQKSNSAL
ncbi:Putative ATP-dependent RNA helicase rha-2, partial [Toxocara canis]